MSKLIDMPEIHLYHLILTLYAKGFIFVKLINLDLNITHGLNIPINTNFTKISKLHNLLQFILIGNTTSLSSREKITRDKTIFFEYLHKFFF